METVRVKSLSQPHEVMQENLKFLREYARRWLMEEDDTLAPIEDYKDVMMQEFLAVGNSLKLTGRDLAVLLFKGIWTNASGGRGRE